MSFNVGDYVEALELVTVQSVFLFIIAVNNKKMYEWRL